jgi:hypothetical protein
MSRSRPPRLLPRLSRALRASTLPVEIVPGTRHWRVLIGGRQVLVLSYGSRNRGDITTDEHDARAVRRYLAKVAS